MADKSAAQIERDKIKVVSSNDPVVEEKEAVVAKDEKEVEEKEVVEPEVVEGDEVEVEAAEEEIEDNKEKIEEHEKTEEELNAEKEAADTAAEKAKIQKRIDREVAKRKAVEDENKKLKKQLEAKVAEGGTALTEEDVETRAEQKANQKAAQAEFNKTSDKLADDVVKLDKGGLKKIDAMCEEIAPIPSVMIGILGDLDNGADVLLHLANNVDVYADIEALKNRPVKLGVELAKLSAKVEKDKKPEPKPISKVPKVNNALGGQSRVNNTGITPQDDKLGVDDWITKRNADVAKKRAAR